MATEYDFELDQGSRFVMVIQPVIDFLPSLAGYSARGSVRASRTLPDEPLLIDLSAFLTVDVANGVVTLDLPADSSAALDFEKAQYDFELFDGNPAHDVRFLQGEIRLNKEVTK